MKYRKMTVIGVVLVLALALGTTAVFATTPPETEETGTEQDYASMTTEELAYCDLDKAPDEATRQAILDARRQIIYSTSWVADGEEAYVVQYPSFEMVEKIPEFHDVFPEDWEVPSSGPGIPIEDERSVEELAETFLKTYYGETDSSAERVVTGFLEQEPETPDPEFEKFARKALQENFDIFTRAHGNGDNAA